MSLSSENHILEDVDYSMNIQKGYGGGGLTPKI